MIVLSFKSDILKQVERIPEGKIFTFSDIVFPMEKFANLAVILSDLSRKGQLVRFEKGAYGFVEKRRTWKNGGC
jgi:predicted transcriptional regulator of viral defense system